MKKQIMLFAMLLVTASLFFFLSCTKDKLENPANTAVIQAPPLSHQSADKIIIGSYNPNPFITEEGVADEDGLKNAGECPYDLGAAGWPVSNGYQITFQWVNPDKKHKKILVEFWDNNNQVWLDPYEISVKHTGFGQEVLILNIANPMLWVRMTPFNGQGNNAQSCPDGICAGWFYIWYW